MLNTHIAATLNTIDTIATIGERTLKVTATVLWFATVAAVAVTGLCINSTAVAREAYAQQTIDLAQNADEIAAFNDDPIALLPAAAEVAPTITFQAFVTQVLQTPATPVDLGPELSDQALQANWATINPAAATSIATEATVTAPTTDLSSLTVRQLKAMAKDRHIPRYSRLRKAELITALAA